MKGLALALASRRFTQHTAFPTPLQHLFSRRKRIHHISSSQLHTTQIMTKETTPPPTTTTTNEPTTTTTHEPPSLPASPLAKRTKPNTDTTETTTTTSSTTMGSTGTPLPPLQVKKLTPTGRAPTRGSAFAAGYDMYSAKETVIPAKGKALVDTGIAIAVPEGTCTYQPTLPPSTFTVIYTEEMMETDDTGMVV